MSFPKPEPGLVIRYSYLWRAEHEKGMEEGSKDRPCVIVLAVERDIAEAPIVLVAPITHATPDVADLALEIPPVIKSRLGLDEEQFWVVVSESNVFRWPGPDLRPWLGSDNSLAYGLLPPKFFNELNDDF